MSKLMEDEIGKYYAIFDDYTLKFWSIRIH